MLDAAGAGSKETLLVVSSCELVRMSQALLYALCYSKGACTIAFCPDVVTKPLVLELCRLSLPSSAIHPRTCAAGRSNHDRRSGGGGADAGRVERGRISETVRECVRRVAHESGVPICLLDMPSLLLPQTACASGIGSCGGGAPTRLPVSSSAALVAPPSNQEREAEREAERLEMMRRTSAGMPTGQGCEGEAMGQGCEGETDWSDALEASADFSEAVQALKVCSDKHEAACTPAADAGVHAGGNTRTEERRGQSAYCDAVPSEAAPAWDEAVPFALTLDVDLKSIGDSEAFKRDVVQDVATAAKIDAKHVKVMAMRAGSVIVDMLIAKEAGDAQKIVQDLEEQLKSPDSLLMQGKLTSKTKKGASAAAPVALKLPPAPSSGARKSTFGLNISHAALSSVHSTPSRSSSAERGFLAPSTVVLHSSAEKERGESGRPMPADVAHTNGVSHAPVDAPRQVKIISLKKKKFV